MRQTIKGISVLIVLFIGVFFSIHVCKAPGASNRIAIENQRAGTTDWQSADLDRAIKTPRIARNVWSYADSGAGTTSAWAGPRPISGYASRASINHGSTIGLFVSTTQPS